MKKFFALVIKTIVVTVVAMLTIVATFAGIGAYAATHTDKSVHVEHQNDSDLRPI